MLWLPGVPLRGNSNAQIKSDILPDVGILVVMCALVLDLVQLLMDIFSFETFSLKHVFLSRLFYLFVTLIRGFPCVCVVQCFCSI